MTNEDISLLHNGSYLMPNSGTVISSIRVIEIKEKGFRFRKCHQYCNGEEFFLSKDALAKSKWIIVPEGTQLQLL